MLRMYHQTTENGVPNLTLVPAGESARGRGLRPSLLWPRGGEWVTSHKELGSRVQQQESEQVGCGESITAGSRRRAGWKLRWAPGSGSRLGNCQPGATSIRRVACFRRSPEITLLFQKPDSQSLGHNWLQKRDMGSLFRPSGALGKNLKDSSDV